jgi:hypothetical protein
MSIALLPLNEPQSIKALYEQVCEGILPLESAFGTEGRDPRPRPQDTYYLAVDDEHMNTGWACGDGCWGFCWTQRPAPDVMAFALGLFQMYRGRGLGPVVRDALVAHCFSNPEIAKVTSEVYACNLHSLGALHGKHRRTKPEGRDFNALCIDGTYYDRLRFGLTRDEWDLATKGDVHEHRSR